MLASLRIVLIKNFNYVPRQGLYDRLFHRLRFSVS